MSNKIKKGKLYLSYHDLRIALGLSDDTHFDIIESREDGIDILVVANSDNDKQWLRDNNNDNVLSNIRRTKIPFNICDCETDSIFSKDFTKAMRLIREMDIK